MGFSTTWLALREPADHAARDAGLLAAAARAAARTAPPVIVDLGCGTGSTIRAFDPHLAAKGNWRLVDNDSALLDHAAQVAGAGVTTIRMDLRDIDALPLDGASLVTASALLDLCSRDWMERLAARLAALRIPFYTALNYDGRMSWSPSGPADDAVTTAFNAHQRGDKGLGPAMGPDSADTIADILTAAGFAVSQADSAWTLTPDHAALQQPLLEGIATAATEAGEAGAQGWLDMRLSLTDRATCLIGHRDLLALPQGNGQAVS